MATTTSSYRLDFNHNDPHDLGVIWPFDFICTGTGYHVNNDFNRKVKIWVIFISRQRAMYAERDIFLLIPSVCPSVWPVPVLCLNEYGHVVSSHFWHSGMGIILVFEPHRRYKIPMETP